MSIKIDEMKARKRAEEILNTVEELGGKDPFAALSNLWSASRHSEMDRIVREMAEEEGLSKKAAMDWVAVENWMLGACYWVACEEVKHKKAFTGQELSAAVKDASEILAPSLEAALRNAKGRSFPLWNDKGVEQNAR